VYRFRDAAERVLYIGRASDLRRRVGSYWTNRDDRRVARLVQLVARVEAVECGSEHEAAWLEHNLLEHHKPRWNRTSGTEVPVYIRLDPRPRSPGLSVIHDVREAPDGWLFGPYLGGLKVRTATSALHRMLPLALSGEGISASERDMARLRGVSPSDRASLIDRIVHILSRDATAISDARQALVDHRNRAANNLSFERAAMIQAELDALDWVVAPQSVTVADACTHHVFGWAADLLVHFEIRNGRMCVWRQGACSAQNARTRLRRTPEQWREFANRNARLAALLV
jgi:excinuclease ABC subunit C